MKMKMKRSDWNEERIKVLLSQLPKVEDSRSSKHIYQKLLVASQMKKKNIKWIGPAVATVVVLFMVFFIAPHLFQQSAQDMKNMDSYADKEGHSLTLETSKRADHTFVVQSSERKKYMTIAYIDESTSQVVPISIKKADQSDTVEDFLRTYEQIELPEMSLSLQPYFDQVDMSEKGNMLVLQLKNELTVDTLKEANKFKDMVKETLKWSKYEQVQFKSSKGTNIHIGSYGNLGIVSIDKKTKRAYYLLDNEKGMFLVPSEQSYQSYEQAIQAMKNPNHSGLESLIQQVPIDSVTANGKHATVTLKATAHLTDSISHILLIEGLLLTAKDFGYTDVTIKNAGTEKVGPYKLEEPIAVPALPNPVNVNHK
ncbi:sigma X negative regulator [Bacillus sp. NPDC077027]|uniref:sigma X negative regulator n=1 Tax=Bacillus sp. NPDC077027 TaxID=3390548 RepID=UPI003D06B412